MPESPGRMPAAPPMNVIIPAAGLGTRLAPASLAVPKELLPLGVHPALVACLLVGLGLSRLPGLEARD